MDRATFAAFTVLNRKLNRLLTLAGDDIMALDALNAEVARNTSAVASAKVALEGLAAEIQRLINSSGDSIDPAELQAVVDNIKANTDQLSEAIAANTPAQA